MHLFLTTATPTNAVYTNESGTPQYKVHTPFKLPPRTTSISRVVDGIPRHSGSAHIHEDREEDGERFASLAHIDWHLVESSVIRFRGHELSAQDFFRKEGLGWFGLGSHRVFTGVDGREYKWSIGAHTTKLAMNGDTDTPVAHYHPKKLGLLSKPQKASLEVFPPFEDMVDEIVVTFVYIERLREEAAGGRFPNPF
ncbi:hypothetical protein DFH09DRAFT_1203046 [Mycena vulgaris]|nr:hypothetical protein DFH09DRAFT_1203046 [Mycena vulgaris]